MTWTQMLRQKYTHVLSNTRKLNKVPITEWSTLYISRSQFIHI